MHTTKISNLLGRRVCLYTCNLLLLLLSGGNLYAQCLVSSLDVSTGHYNSTTVAAGLNDPHWNCIGKSGNFLGSIPGTPAPALVVTPHAAWASGGKWICDKQSDVTPGIITNATSGLTFERSFKICHDDSVQFNFGFRTDGYIVNLLIDGVSTGLVQITSNWAGGALWMPTPFTRWLTMGTHTIDIQITEPPQNQADPIGFYLNGTITSTGLSIVNDQDPGCANYLCANEPTHCDDLCYWTVDGNNIYSGRNIFGTLSDNNIRIVTNSSSTPDRGVITGGNPLTGGYLGWNTINPTARLHVNCINGNNPEYIPGQPSDIRFEKLEPGSGNILVIDKQGYVYDSQVPVRDADGLRNAPGGIAEMQQEIRDLKMQLAALRSVVVAGNTGKILPMSNILYQNTPNPFNKETSVRYSITRMQETAFIAIYDLNGKELKKYRVSAGGEGSIIVNAESLLPGIYLYSLVIDGQEADTKRMVLSN